MKYKYVLPALPYDFGALEPHIDALTMEIHHGRHHQTYIDNLNAALEKNVELQQKDLNWLLENLDKVNDEQLRTTIRNNGGGHYNHSFFWQIMKKNGGGLPKGPIADAIKNKFQTFELFKEQFNGAAKKVFGSGWAWLVFDKNGQLQIITTTNQDATISNGHIPILGLDVWEHAYYLKYQNKRPDYINAWWNVINWDQVEANFEKAK